MLDWIICLRKPDHQLSRDICLWLQPQGGASSAHKSPSPAGTGNMQNRMCLPDRVKQKAEDIKLKEVETAS